MIAKLRATLSRTSLIAASAGMLGASTLAIPAYAQDGAEAAQTNCATRLPTRPLVTYESVETMDDGRMLFRLCAPEAEAVTLQLRGDVNAASQSVDLTKGEEGFWTGTTAEPVMPGYHRYSFEVDGLNFPDPMNLEFEQTIRSIVSLVRVDGPGTEFYDFDPEIEHGALSIVEYWNDDLGIKRRMRVYTPPGYMKDDASYPVLYLIHGGGGSDDVWSSTGQANHIFDNLIAEGKAKKMIVVMPEAHTPITDDLNIRYNTRFRDDLFKEVIPYVDAHFRTVPEPESRAMAGLSMGSAHTLNFGLPRSDVFRYIGAFSMGYGSSDNPPSPEAERIAMFERDSADGMRQSAKDMELVYFGFGDADPWYYTVAPTKAMFDKYGIDYEFVETPGAAHEWLLWRQYLADFSSRLFR